jgi:rhamnosyltransferase
LLGSRGIPNRFGGFEANATELAYYLPKEAFQIYVACESSLRSAKVAIPGVRLVYFPVIERFRVVSGIIYDILSLVWASWRKIDVIYMYGYSAALFFIIPRLFGKVIVVNVDGFEWQRTSFSRLQRFLLKIFERMATKTADYILCDSEAVLHYFRQRYGVEGRYIPYGAPIVTAAEESGLNRLGLLSRAYFLVLARLEPENNIDLIIDAFLQSKTDRRLVIVGSLHNMSYRKKISNLLRHSGSRVLYLGPIYDLKLVQALRFHSYAYIHGHEVGGTNPSLLEALGSSSAIIALDVPFNREVCGDAAAYFRKDSKNLAELIDRLSRDEELVARMRIMAREIALRRYSREAVISGYTTMFRELKKPRNSRFAGKGRTVMGTDSDAKKIEAIRRAYAP